LVQPVDGAELEACRPGREEALEERLKELLEQHLQALVVVGAGGLRHARLSVNARPEKRNGSGTPVGVGKRSSTPSYSSGRFPIPLFSALSDPVFRNKVSLTPGVSLGVSFPLTRRVAKPRMGSGEGCLQTVPRPGEEQLTQRTQRWGLPDARRTTGRDD